MANPQKENGFSPLANEILEALYKRSFTSYETRVLEFIFRFTYGFNRKEATLSLRFIAAGTGILPTHISRTIKMLQEKKVITKLGSTSLGNSYKFNKNHQEWLEKTATTGVTQPGSTSPGNLLLPSQVTKKENIKSNKDINTKSDFPPTPQIPPVTRLYRDGNPHLRPGDMPSPSLDTDPIETWDEYPDFPNFWLMLPKDQMPKNKEEMFAMWDKWAQIAPVQGRSKKGLYPCTWEEIYQIGFENKYWIKDVLRTHREVLEMVAAGNKYKVKTVYLTLQKWLQRSLRLGQIELLDEVQMIDYQDLEPVAHRKGRMQTMAHARLVKLERAESEKEIKLKEGTLTH